MQKSKLLTGVLLVLAVLFAQVGTVFAAPAAQDTTWFTGTVASVGTETDASGVTTVLVTLVDSAGQTHDFRLIPEYAATLGLVTLSTDANGAQVVTPIVLTTTPLSVTIDPAMVIQNVNAEEDVHPIAAILASFFEVDAGEVNDLHEEGFGFGLIAQAMWMAKNYEQETVTAGVILRAKRDQDYSAITLSDGSHPKNWGQLRKALLDKKNNLGVIVSGHAANDGTDPAVQSNNGHGKDKDNKGKGNNKKP